MSRTEDYALLPTDAGQVLQQLLAEYRRLAGKEAKPASPEYLFLCWAAAAMTQERVLANYAANQNIPSRAEGENLDALGELFGAGARPEAKAATCRMRFTLSQAQNTAILIPQGTRVTDSAGTLTWETTQDTYFPIGSKQVEAQVRCQTPGAAGNGYAIGRINALVDLYDYCAGCQNITESEGGADRATDREYYQLMRQSLDSFSTAGARGGYLYHAKKVSTEILDVAVNSPTPGVVKLYVLMEGGKLAGEEMKSQVLAACSDDRVRPLTDRVLVEDARQVSYDIRFTYYLPSDGDKSAADIAAAVQRAVEQYQAWQCARLGRDINPSHLLGLLMQTGVKRVELTAPAFLALTDGRDKQAPQVAAAGTVEIINGGFEDE